ncbi:M57 family metalloprotease [Parapedobacter deserti]|uniref:M57 family metalloprotease n=1 Tax=Parapedobacter deserti TaxID=1912957 RepID=A0ABV7JSD2_9SPHI
MFKFIYLIKSLSKIGIKGGIFTLSLCLLLSFESCKRQDFYEEDTSVNRSDQRLYDVLIKAGVKRENIKDTGTGYLVEGDILFVKFKTDIDEVERYFGIHEDQLKDKLELTKLGSISKDREVVSQWRTSNIVSYDNSKSIVISIQNDIKSTYWSSVYNAAANWTGISNTTLSIYGEDFGYFNSITTNRITITSGSFGQGFYAVAEFPTIGSPGFQIVVNRSMMDPLSFEQKVFIITHELGHCIGLRHTDYPGTDGYGTILVSGTPTSDGLSMGV